MTVYSCACTCLCKSWFLGSEEKKELESNIFMTICFTFLSFLIFFITLNATINCVENMRMRREAEAQSAIPEGETEVRVQDLQQPEPAQMATLGDNLKKTKSSKSLRRKSSTSARRKSSVSS